MILTLPIEVAKILDGTYTQEDIIETREHLSVIGQKMQYTWCFPTHRDEQLRIIRCKGCGEYFDWHEMHLEGRNRYRNTCPDCYNLVYAKGSTDGKSSKQRQQEQGTLLYTGTAWAYMIMNRGSATDKETGNRHAVTSFYFGATENIISRLRQQETHSSNPGQQRLFQTAKESLAYGFLPHVSTFQVFPFQTLQDAYKKEQELYDYWKEQEHKTETSYARVIVNNEVRPPGVPPQ